MADTGENPKKVEGNIVEVAVSNDGPQLEVMHEDMKRPRKLIGETYKVKSPLSDNAFFVTINDVILNEGTEWEERRPFEMFVNTKNVDDLQWIMAFTRTISATFRKGGNVEFLVEELRSVYDPNGGYFQGGRFRPSVIAELGDILEEHFQAIGLMAKPEMSQAVKEQLDIKKKEAEETGAFDNATICNNCHEKAVVHMDGCNMCLECGDSKCN